MAEKKKNEVQEIIDYLISVGAHEITEEEKQTEWYKKEMASIEGISCKYETDEEFEEFCRK